MSGRLGADDAGTGTSEQRELHARFATGERVTPGSDFTLVDANGRLTGPPATWVLSPVLGLALEPLGKVIRYGLSLPRRAHELVILEVARVEDSPFERYAHMRAGRAAGLSEQEIESILDGTIDGFDDPIEDAAFALARRLLTGGELRDEHFDSALATLGRPTVFDVVTLVGYYRMIAMQLRAFDIQPPD